MFALMTRSGEGVQSASLMSSARSPPSGGWGIELRVLTLEPRLVVVRVLYLQRRLGDFQRPEAVHHHRQLVGILGADARFRAPRMRPVRNSVRMMRDATKLDSLPAHELARRVVQHFVGVDVAVIVGSRHRFGMKVVRPRAERADDEAIALESLMHRRWLVDAPDDWLEVVDV